MTRLAAFHDAFVEAIVESQPDALADFLDDPSKADRALVYRNTVFRGAADALASTYPSVERLAGRAFFDQAAVAFIAGTPPRTRTLVGYGESFAKFLEQMPEIEAAPYLPDAARLDWGWLQAHLAADAPYLETEALAKLPPDRLAVFRPALHPSVQIAATTWNIYDAWAANRDEGGDAQEPRCVERMRSWALLWRLDDEVRHAPLSEAEATFFLRLLAGSSLGEAADSALAASPDFQTDSVFAAALQARLFTGLPDNWGNDDER